MRLLLPPGVFRPLSDTWMLADALRREPMPSGFRALDLCTGSGALAISAALAGAGTSVAVDRSRRAVLAARINGRLNGVAVDARRGNLFGAVAGERFDLIVSNPPYIPAETDAIPDRGPRRWIDAGRDGRVLLDRICADAPRHLRAGGVILLIHSSINGAQETVERLADGGLEADVAVRHRGPLGPILTARAEILEERGLLAPGEREEDLVIVRGVRPSRRFARGEAPAAAPVGG